MKIIESPQKLQQFAQKQKKSGKTIGLVPTMGALHQGHFSLIKKSVKKCDVTIASIFVNPTQFGANEDLGKYPRTLEEDIKGLKANGADALFLPSNENMYPEGYNTWVEVKELTEGLCGKSRPTHFRGVTTVVSKLFNVCLCDMAFFGQKDYQQAMVIKRMTEDLNFPVKIVVCPIVREKDGLAMSSRNKYLTGELRTDALVLSIALKEAKTLIKNGETNVASIKAVMEKCITTAKSAKIDYIEIIHPETLQNIDTISGDCVIALAVYIGTTRLIDNEIICNSVS